MPWGLGAQNLGSELFGFGNSSSISINVSGAAIFGVSGKRLVRASWPRMRACRVAGICGSAAFGSRV